MVKVKSEMSSRFVRLSLVSCFGVLLLSAVTAQAQDKFGYVLDIRGTWKLNSSATLFKGGSVPVGGTISTISITDPGTYIVVADRAGNIVQQRHCGNAGECSAPIKLPAAAGGGPSLASRIIGAAMALVSNEPSKYASLVSRGAELQEGVVKLEGNQVDLSSVFKNMNGDHYLLRIEPVRGAATISRGRTPKPLEFTWDPRKPTPLIVNQLTPGLYKVRLLDADPGGEHEPTGNDAWVCLTGPNQYARAATSFDEATRVTKQWGADVKQNTVREFLRASLEVINAQDAQ
jgi:hypothetical protein